MVVALALVVPGCGAALAPASALLGRSGAPSLATTTPNRPKFTIDSSAAGVGAAASGFILGGPPSRRWPSAGAFGVRVGPSAISTQTCRRPKTEPPD